MREKLRCNCKGRAHENHWTALDNDSAIGVDFGDSEGSLEMKFEFALGVSNDNTNTITWLVNSQ